MKTYRIVRVATYEKAIQAESLEQAYEKLLKMPFDELTLDDWTDEAQEIKQGKIVAST